MSQSLLSGSQKGKKQKIETGGPGRLETMAAYVLVSTSVIRSSKIPSTWRTEVFCLPGFCRFVCRLLQDHVLGCRHFTGVGTGSCDCAKSRN